MIRLSAVALAGLLPIACAVSADAKGYTLEIAILGVSEQSQPVRITDAAVGAFHVWAGPGVRINGVPQSEGFIADWNKGALDKRSEGLRQYRVSFYTGCRAGELSCSKPEARLSYVVLYEYDAASNIGYVYLPGKGEDGHELNTGSILRGVEGRWFRATDEWALYIAPILAKMAQR